MGIPNASDHAHLLPPPPPPSSVPPGQPASSIDVDHEAPRLGGFLDQALAKLARRRQGLDKPVTTQFAILDEYLGGGLFTGLHVLVGNTKAGKSQFSLQLAVQAAQAGVPVLYLALELDAPMLVARVVGLLSGTRWQSIYLGKADPDPAAVERMRSLPLRILTAQPLGWSYDRLLPLVEGVARLDGTAPFVVLDYLQLVVSPGNAGREDLRERIRRAAYAGRMVAMKTDAVVLLISSTARANYEALTGESGAGTGRPNGRHRGDSGLGKGSPDRFIGSGKESGEIEYAADTVLILGSDGWTPSVGAQAVQSATRMWVGVAGTRAGGKGWVELRFDGNRFTVPQVTSVKIP